MARFRESTSPLERQHLANRKRSMTSSESHRVTMEKCPRCGEEAAVGWRTVGAAHSSWPVVEYAVEFDCATGCGLSVEEMVWSFPSAVTGQPWQLPDHCVRRPDSGEDVAVEGDPVSYRPAGVPEESSSVGGIPARLIDTLELIPGHADTVAEVWLWHGRVPEVSDDPRIWISLKSDDWPMCPATARCLASALMAAAAVAES